MRAIVYVEGASDAEALRALLRPIIENGRANGIGIGIADQNGNEPPKRVVQKLFTKYLERKYQETVDAKWILERADLAAVEAACSQHFKPFVQELREIVAGRDPVF